MFPPIADTFLMTRNLFSFRLFGPRATCSACNTQVYGNDIIMRKGHETIYHVYCFFGVATVNETFPSASVVSLTGQMAKYFVWTIVVVCTRKRNLEKRKKNCKRHFALI